MYSVQKSMNNHGHKERNVSEYLIEENPLDKAGRGILRTSSFNSHQSNSRCGSPRSGSPRCRSVDAARLIDTDEFRSIFEKSLILR
jgi:hypothetical protein